MSCRASHVCAAGANSAPGPPHFSSRPQRTAERGSRHHPEGKPTRGHAAARAVPFPPAALEMAETPRLPLRPHRAAAGADWRGEKGLKSPNTSRGGRGGERSGGAAGTAEPLRGRRDAPGPRHAAERRARPWKKRAQLLPQFSPGPAAVETLLRPAPPPMGRRAAARPGQPLGRDREAPRPRAGEGGGP